MTVTPWKFAGRAALATAMAALVTACQSPEPGAGLAGSGSGEYFSEAEYGVEASPRVSAKRSGLRRGGGRAKIGKPYKVKGKWYHPAEEPDYKKVGAASWYGDAFHGRRTANGEVYDMTHLTAAHPTMPLPSYARVTNLSNGSSLVVRVNDRGPFARGRIIDLSKRAAGMLDYSHAGVAKVEVEYLGRAPLDGRDDGFLTASYEPGEGAPDTRDGAPPGVIVAMNGATPGTRSDGARIAFASQPAASRPIDSPLPPTGPLVPDRPQTGSMPPEGEQSLQLLSYANRRVRGAGTEVFDAVVDAGPEPADIVRSWRQGNGRSADSEHTGEYIAAGSWAEREAAERRREAVSGYGRTVVETSLHGGENRYSLTLYPDGRHDLDTMLQAAWAAGVDDALVVRD